jgi:proteasome lid subunit RPN8/RPN11
VSCSRVVFCQVELSEADRSLVRRSPIDYVCVCVSECDPETSAMRKPTRAVEVLKNSLMQTYNIQCVDNA